MKSCAAGLRVLSFNVTMPTGHGSIGGSTGKALRVDRGLKCITLPGRVLRKRPVANIFWVSSVELVITSYAGALQFAGPEADIKRDRRLGVSARAPGRRARTETC